MVKKRSEKPIEIRQATPDDLEILLGIEQRCFPHDRLSRRSFKRWLKSEQGVLLLVEHNRQPLAYGLVWCLKGTRLARLYSIAVLPEARGSNVAQSLIEGLEHQAVKRGYLYMRLEVATSNSVAIRFYERNGYRVFGHYSDYYDDHDDALRMQKTIQSVQLAKRVRNTVWYQQTTDFTCGPASLMMAMNSLDSSVKLSQGLELDLWREATTIFMTSGHGGCHPVGLACAARRRGFDAKVYLNVKEPLFISSVRSQQKKEVLELVHKQFLAAAKKLDVNIVYSDVTQDKLSRWLQQGCAVIVLVSTFRLDGKKAPHWVTVTAVDDQCLYVHDPDPDELTQRAIDCQHLPIAREDFEKMSVFGSSRLRTAVVISRSED